MKFYSLCNSKGIEVVVSSYGGIIQKLMVPDRHGDAEDVTLGFDTVEEYQNGSPYFGALIGRYGNRISDSRFCLNGKEFRLEANDGNNHLHGGLVGFDKVVWNVEEFSEKGVAGLRLHYRSADGEEGYPGELDVEVMYGLNDTDDLTIIYKATTTESTHVNLTQHAYFNLGGHDMGSIEDHEIRINADFFTPTDKESIPTGEILSVEGSAFDLRSQTRIEDVIHGDDEQLEFGRGFDHNFVLSKLPCDFSYAATVADPKSGRLMEVYTTEPGVQFYTGNNLNGIPGKGGAVYQKRAGLCLETQHFPDTPNKSMFPSTRLDPGQEYLSKTVYKFGII